MEYPIFRQNHVNSGFSWGKLVVMIWTMKRWDMKQEVCNGDMKQQTTGMWTDNHGTWNNINMNKSMWWFRAITSLGVNKWIMKCQKHETNFPFGFFFLEHFRPQLSVWFEVWTVMDITSPDMRCQALKLSQERLEVGMAEDGCAAQRGFFSGSHPRSSPAPNQLRSSRKMPTSRVKL